ncbi:FG-GAP-like repeat-containing protein [Sphingomonas glaciei]|uniref:FG-GAP-like repeat-containing protein n=1 Tax=Sphingomonas glaciei TaxID=2938948 RepID=A0ABY5MUE1_9SPHN|nr:FG-GAP-like repeat-containing protein [Sphingomonas glaciei]UUR08105.1 FG-GAP-like repeat-containing protein [Sphingomonas glaciei]
MARVVAFEQFDLSSVDLSFYLRTSVGTQQQNNGQFTFAGVTYQDKYTIRSANGTELVFLGSNFTSDANGRLLSGTVSFFGVVETGTNRLYWYTSGVTIGAAAFYDAITTTSNADDLGLITAALNGNDSITLSLFNDRIDGSAGNDTITGGLGQDWLAGGSGNDTFLDTAAGLNGDTLADFAVGDRIVISDATLANFSGSVSGSTLTFTGGSLTFGSAITSPLVLNAAVGGGVALTVFTSQFAPASGVLVSNFAVGAGGWSSQDLYPRHIADVNGDGFNDIVGFGQSGVVVAFGSANGTFAAPRLATASFGQSTGWTSDNQFHRELADVNGDGRADIVGFSTTGTVVSFGRADGTFTDPIAATANFGTNQGWTTQDRNARTTGDVNGDGKADIIGFGTAGTLVALGNGDGTFQVAKVAVANFGVQQGWTSDNLFHRTVADVNGDGDDDVLGFGTGGTWVALSNGDGTFQAAQLKVANFGTDQGWSSQNSFARDVGDVNGDGFADVVGFGVAGTFVAYGTADGSLVTPRLDIQNFGANQGWTNDNNYHRELADLNNDGAIDVVGFGQDGVLAGFNQGLWLM